jgi:ABC transport system ATP-binding/permease protein
MAPPLLSLRDIHLTFGGAPLLTGAELAVFEGDRLCLVGRNGSGKSTLLKIAAGFLESDKGERVVRTGTTIRYLPQEPDLDGFETVLAYVEAGLGPQGELHKARTLLGDLGLTGDEHPSQLSGGEARRAAIARALAPDPDILLIDEPTNHLDLPAIEWLEGTLKGVRSALVLISHDRRFLETLSRATLWLDRGQVRHLSRGFKEFEAWRDATLAEEEANRHKLERKIIAETDWQYYGGVTARRRRNEGRTRKLVAMREKLRTDLRAQGNVKLTVSEGDLSGRMVAEAKGISKAYGETVLVKDLSVRIQRGDRIGIVGPNGSGKTTLLNLLTGALAPDGGTIRHGANLQLVTLDQSRDSLDPQSTVSEALTGGRGDTVHVGGQSKHVISYMKDFLFSSDQARTPVRVLSGGERGRLMLARALAKPSNVLVLDEPTNDLDLETLDLLQEMLDDYPGTVLLVSHDRDFIDRVVTSVIVSEGAGHWVEYAGGYTDMLAQRGKGVEARVANGLAVKGGAIAGGQTHSAGGRQGLRSDPNQPPPRRKLTFKDKHALETLPVLMEKLGQERRVLQARMAAPDLYANDPKTFAKVTARLGEIETELAAAEEEWLRLELLREEIEG